ncbi:MAG: hypothetical protein U9N72_07755 [Bacteroidota bacterium]|nr:hypothetical protein [Bacteroidota bacterium]
MKTIVVYYSNKGSNEYLANKISKSLSCDIVEIKTSDWFCPMIKKKTPMLL